ncbi:hypothetical protein GDO81_003101 [Engystomops pustulosus]|uniref:Uncharacterized protein n=1 Tax=Engystomops pustulosus TaxID=76066 RepID=A0AAV7A3F2_ENGPU|nr:hypothetical protein GDO81_003101 [Engystomops pustulosus]
MGVLIKNKQRHLNIKNIKEKITQKWQIDAPDVCCSRYLGGSCIITGSAVHWKKRSFPYDQTLLDQIREQYYKTRIWYKNYFRGAIRKVKS